MSIFTEQQLEEAIVEMLTDKGYEHLLGENILNREITDVLIKDDIRNYLRKQYEKEGITSEEIDFLIRELESLDSALLYDSNRKFIRWLQDGYKLTRFDRSQKDILIRFIDFESTNNNTYKVVNQLQILENYTPYRIPDALIYINGLPLVVFEFKSTTREEATIFDAFEQITKRYKRDIPSLFLYNALCVISDGVNSKMGSFFAAYEYYYAWRKVTGDEVVESEGIDSLVTMIDGLFTKERLLEVTKDFIFFPDSSKKEEKIVCRYPQYFAATKLYKSIYKAMRPEGDGKGGTYFGATGSGKSYAMLYLTRLLMRSPEFENPTIVLITDRVDLDDQLTGQFVEAKKFFGEENITNVESRSELGNFLGGRESGGVFLTTIHKFTESAGLLSDRSNIICISDEAHRSQTNLDQKVKITEDGTEVTYGFAKYLHDSLPNATYVGFTGTPIDATFDVFGEVVDQYTMTESVFDEITVPIVYEGRAARVRLNEESLKEIEDYYQESIEVGASEYQVEESKKQMSRMTVLLSDPDVIRAIAIDFVNHYEGRINEGATIAEKAMLVCPSRPIAFSLYTEILNLRPAWAEVREAVDLEGLNETQRQELYPIERIKLVMNRGNNDSQDMWDIAGDKAYHDKLAKQFKSDKSNLKVIINVDMWLTGFDVPSLDTMYIYKPLSKHTLIQTISRVNRKYKTKDRGLVVDYFGFKREMNKALGQYGSGGGAGTTIEDIEKAIKNTKDYLDLLDKYFHGFTQKDVYFDGSAVERLMALNLSAEFVMRSDEQEKRFIEFCRRLKAAYDICAGNLEAFDNSERDRIHFYLAVRTIVFKLTRGNAPDTAQMNKVVTEMVHEALQSEGVEEIFKLGDKSSKEINLFDPDFLEKIRKIKMPNAKIRLLEMLLEKEINALKKINKVKGIEFADRFKKLVDKYNNRKEQDVLISKVLEEFTEEIINLVNELGDEKESFKQLGIDIEEKSFYDILKALTIKYDFEYPEDRLLELSKKVKEVVDDKTRYPAWDERADIKAELRADLVVLLSENDYPPIAHDEAYKDIFEQAENFKKHVNS
ncbi:MAG: type I restriction endonuclease subunit R [Pseudomonadales bacterium]|nr:type I restriction endonuclease subunit R [Pseudomonadales bacterium]